MANYIADSKNVETETQKIVFVDILESSIFF